MSHYFLDSSALVKRYVVETGTDWIRSVTARSNQNVVVIAHITQTEVVSSAMRRKREGTISAETARAIRRLVDLHVSQEYTVIGLVEQIVRRAEDLLELYPLRAYDSIQLASAIESHVRLMARGLSPLTFVAADNRLLEIASQEGLATDNPNAYP